MSDSIVLGAWEQFANCLGADPDLFFPHDRATEAAAKAVCGGCEVRRECLELAVVDRIPDGIWGGLTAAERRALWRSARQRLRVV